MVETTVFRPDPTLTFIPAAPDVVVRLIESLNEPQLSIPSKPPQAAHGFLCGLRNPNGSFSIFVAMWLKESGENVIYANEPAEFAYDEYGAVEAEALHFLESMGFMLDDLRFRQLGPEQQQAAIDRIPLFRPPQPRKAAAAQGPDDPAARQAALVRLLASF